MNTEIDAVPPVPSTPVEPLRLLAEDADDLQIKITEMQAMQRTLRDLASRCHGDNRPECPILDDLASPTNGH